MTLCTNNNAPQLVFSHTFMLSTEIDVNSEVLTFCLIHLSVHVHDRTLANKASSGKVIDVYFRPEGIWCSHCQADSCRHIAFALRVPSIQEVVVKKRREGWKLPPIEE